MSAQRLPNGCGRCRGRSAQSFTFHDTGAVMRPEDLRETTRSVTAERKAKLGTRWCTGERADTKRVATVRQGRALRSGACLALVTALASCQPSGVPQAPAGALPDGPLPPDAGALTSVARLTPEQVSKTFLAALGTDYGISDPDSGAILSYATHAFSVPLGGVDFLARVRDRDPSTKVQTLLVARGITWGLATKLVEHELEAPPPADTLFTRCRFGADYPGLDEAARARWEAQVQELYARLFSRRATSEELALLADTFNRIVAREGTTAPAWLATLYALISSMETWHAWR